MPCRFDYHTHTRASFDGTASLAEMARAAVEAGLTEVAVTDHCDFGGQQPGAIDPLPPLEFDRISLPITLVRGAEIGQPHHEPEAANAFLDSYRPEFTIGSLHNLRGQMDFYYMTYNSAEAARALVRDYVAELFELVRWGRFSVLGHLTYPVRYIPPELKADFAPHWADCEELFRKLIQKGIGIELNVSGLARPGQRPYPDLPLLRLYRQTGGEIVTIGSDAHSPQTIGQHIDDGLALLRQAGFRAVAGFSGGKLRFEPIE